MNISLYCFTILITLIFSTSHCQHITVCKQIQPNNYDPNDLKKQCIRQTVFVHEIKQQTNNSGTAKLFMNLTNGWVTPLNGYQYKLTPNKQTWQQSRTICQQLGGDLAVYGVQNMESRRLILRALSAPADNIIWIGLNDIKKEGEWFWVNGDRTVQSAVLWAHGQPDNANNEDCGEILTSKSRGYGTNDIRCSDAFIALCEKQYNR